MKRFLLILSFAVGILVVILLGIAWRVSSSGLPSYERAPITFNVDPTPVKIQKGVKLSSMLCNHCHMSATARQLTGRKVEDIDPVFGEIYSPNITQDSEVGIGSWTASDIAYLIRTGIKKDGTYAPPYMPKLPLMSDQDLESIIAFLKSSHPLVAATREEAPESKPSFMTKMLSRVAFKPLPYPSQPIPEPDTTDVVAWGKYLANGVYGCFHCHSADFKTNNELFPENSEGFYGGGNQLYNLEGEPVLTPNITPHETGIGNWSESEFVKSVKYGQQKDGSNTAYPMLAYAALSDREVKAIFAYLQTVPKIENEVRTE